MRLVYYISVILITISFQLIAATNLAFPAFSPPSSLSPNQMGNVLQLKLENSVTTQQIQTIKFGMPQGNIISDFSQYELWDVTGGPSFLASGNDVTGNVVMGNVEFMNINFPLSIGNSTLELRANVSQSPIGPFAEFLIHPTDLILVGGNSVTGNSISSGNIQIGGPSIVLTNPGQPNPGSINGGMMGNVLRFRVENMGSNEVMTMVNVSVPMGNVSSDLTEYELWNTTSTPYKITGGNSPSGNLVSGNIQFGMLNESLMSGNSDYELRVLVASNPVSGNISFELGTMDVGLGGGNSIGGNMVISSQVINLIGNAPGGASLSSEIGALNSLNKGAQGNVLKFSIQPTGPSEELMSLSVDIGGVANAATEFDFIELVDVNGVSLAQGTLNSLSADFNSLMGNVISSNTIFGINLQVAANAVTNQFTISLNPMSISLTGGNTVTGGNVMNSININQPVMIEEHKAAVGQKHFLVIQSGNLYSAGSNDFGEAARGGDMNQFHRVGAKSDWRSVAAGATHSVVLDLSGNVYVSGSNEYGQLGQGNNNGLQNLMPVTGVGNVLMIAAGAYSSYAVNDMNQLYAWGRNQNGQLGDLTFVDRLSPVMISLPAGNVQSISAGISHVNIVIDGELHGWGNNGFGELGTGSMNANSNNPALIDNNQIWKEVCAGGFHSVALTQSGNCYVWGKNTYGQLAKGDRVNRFVIELTINGVAGVSAGYDHSFILMSDNAVKLTGSNSFGQGSNNMNDNLNWVQFDGNYNYEYVKSGSFATILKRAGQIYVIGRLGNTQLFGAIPRTLNP